MKRIMIYCLLTILASSFTTKAQSKFSYAFQTNTSGALGDQTNICILQTSGGNCYDLAKTWKVNFTAAVNYQVSDRLRLQSGMGHNIFQMDQLNEAFSTSRYQIKYLSIPIKAHYFISKGKLRFYVGGGLRTDIRLNKQSTVFGGAFVQDNGSAFGLSLETLLGLEFNLLPAFSLGFEPTFSTALTSYQQDLKFDATSYTSNSIVRSFTLLNFIDEKPDRLGVTLSLNYYLK